MTTMRWIQVLIIGFFVGTAFDLNGNPKMAFIDGHLEWIGECND